MEEVGRKRGPRMLQSVVDDKFLIRPIIIISGLIIFSWAHDGVEKVNETVNGRLTNNAFMDVGPR